MSETNVSRRCPACARAMGTDLLRVRENMFGITEEFDYAVCAGCGSLALVSIPEDMSSFYPTDYYSVDLDPERALGAPGVRQLARLVIGSVLWGGGVVSGRRDRGGPVHVG